MELWLLTGVIYILENNTIYNTIQWWDKPEIRVFTDPSSWNHHSISWNKDSPAWLVGSESSWHSAGKLPVNLEPCCLSLLIAVVLTKITTSSEKNRNLRTYIRHYGVKIWTVYLPSSHHGPLFLKEGWLFILKCSNVRFAAAMLDLRLFVKSGGPIILVNSTVDISQLTWHNWQHDTVGVYHKSFCSVSLKNVLMPIIIWFLYLPLNIIP